ncbi:MAG: hypothetical protein MUF24_10615 [Chitinophagaceae bacterium]|nr:hypothetical protein [Chitinophagaceae bacterium]
MKRVYFLLVASCLFSGGLLAQGKPIIKVNPQKVFKDTSALKALLEKRNLSPGNIKQLKQLLQQQGISPQVLQPVAENDFGTVYTLPQDNMPMLKPHTNNVEIPGATVLQPAQPQNGQVPNALNVQPYIFVPVPKKNK